MKKIWKDYDFTLMFTPLILTAFGVVMIYSASMVYAVVKWGYASDHYLFQQLKWVFLGSLVFLFTMAVPYQKYQKWMKLIVMFVFFSLIGVLVFGKNVGNAKSWFDLGVFSYQPSEVAKLGLIMYLSSVFAKKQNYIGDFAKAVLPPLAVTIGVLGLIGMQPDIGTAAIVFMIASVVILSSGIRFKHIFLLSVLTALITIIMVPGMKTEERSERFTGAYQPFQLPEDEGYHLIQSFIAIGTGGLSGEGLGNSVQKLGYLLEPHTDFIMAIVAEELGLFGVLFVIGSLSIIVLRGLFIARKCHDAFGSLLAIGISSMIGIQAFINMGAISGILPVTGVPLPFVSYGGSSLLVLFASVGILNNIAKQVKAQDNTSYTTTQPTQQPTTQRTSQQSFKGGRRQWVR
ncbi:FtsW/RodA/SpoVE family cell cycle protein [Pontibacillus sp. HMF3514]|uniref:FtsW/RodA/SpoVE family cell cycle protein n=1 Tax=Pontibacillus sp. HMF3514 TaxID=2692425 RepID=UPI001F405E2C|nr:FtsW/RodA/SpoVE family cell cycle protein [Pontibacillus sp. HMF3514]